MKVARYRALVACALLLAAALRFLGTAQGWPRNYVPDTTVVRAALSLGSGTNPFLGDPLPTQYPYFLPYLLFCAYGAFFVVGLAAEAFRNLDDFRAYAFANPQVFFVIARCVVAGFGCAQVLLVASIARRTLNDSAAVMAAFFCATSLLLVALSQQARPHIVAGTLILWSTSLTLRYVRRQSRAPFYLAWLTSALAASTVPNALPAVSIPILGSVLARDRGSTLARIALGAATFLIVLVLCYPRLALGPADSFAYDSSAGLIRYYGGLYLAPKFVNGRGLARLLRWLALYEPVLASFALFGVIGAIRARPTNECWALLAIYPVFYLVIFGSYEVVHPRYLVALIPFLSIPAGACAAELKRRLAGGLAPRSGPALRAMGAGFSIFVFLIPVTQSLRLDYVLLHEDTRNTAEAWTRRNLGNSRLIALEAHGIELPPNRASVERMASQSPRSMGIRDRHRLEAAATDAPGSGFPILRLWDLRGYAQKPVDELDAYGEIDDVVVVKAGDRPRNDPFYVSLSRKGRLLTQIRPFRPGVQRAETLSPLELRNPLLGLWRIDRPGPVIEIYELMRQ